MRRGSLGIVVLAVITVRAAAEPAGRDVQHTTQPPDCHLASGRVVDGTGAALAGVEVLRDGAVVAASDGTGCFSLCLDTPGPVTLGLRLPGYAAGEIEVRSIPGAQAPPAVATLWPASFLEKVTVVAPANRTVEPVEVLTPKTIAATPGAGEDVLQALRVLPGVVSVDDWTSRLYIRGGRPDQNGIYIDGIPVYDAYRLFGMTSLFNPETVNSIALYPGGFGVEYGDRLSAVIAVENRDGTTGSGFAGSADVNLTNANLVAEGAFPGTRTASWMVSARRSYYDLLVKQSGEYDSEFPNFLDAQIRLLYELSPEHRLDVTLLGYEEGTDLAEDVEPDFGNVDDRVEAADDQKGAIAGVHGRSIFGDGVRLDWTLSATSNEQTSDIFYREGETGFESTLDQELSGEVVALRSVLELDTHDHTLQFGLETANSSNSVEFHFRTQDPRIVIPPELLDFRESQDFRKLAAFAQDTWRLNPAVSLRAGVRWDRSTLSDMSTVSPRASLRWTPSPNWEGRLAWGQYTQFPSYESLQGDGYFLDLRGIAELGLEPESAEHLVVGIGHTSRRGFKVGVDLYDKELGDLLQSGREVEDILVLDGDNQARSYSREIDTYVPENTREGYARGCEVTFTLLERGGRPFYGMVAYAIGETRTRDERGWLWEGHDQRHSVSLVGGWRIGRSWEIGARWRYASGFPYTPLTNVIRVVEDLDGDGVYEPEAGEWFTYQRDEPYAVWRSERLPAYHRLDLRVQYEKRFTSIDAAFYLDVINAYARENVLGYDYNEDFSERKASEGMPFLPSVGVRLAF